MGKYKVVDILNHAIEIEVAGQKFYTMLAERLENEQLKKIFTIMAHQEAGHLNTYQKLREQLSATPDNTQQTDADHFDPVKNKLLEDRIFNRLEVVKKVSQLTNLGDALAYMIDIEIDVVDYFENVRKLITPDGQALMIKIINEEKNHVKQLVDLRRQYQSASLR